MDDLFMPTRHKIDVDAFERMGEAGIFEGGGRVELIDGELIDMAPTGQGHDGAVAALTHALVLACGGRGIVLPGGSVRLGRLDEPLPDFTVLRWRRDFYATGERHGPADILLLVEVADSSLRFDRTIKRALYARFGVPDYWIVDVKGRVVEAHRRPEGDNYAEVTRHDAGERLALAAEPEITVPLRTIFG